VSVTGPYLHDGSASSLEAAIRAHDAAAPVGDAQLAELTAFLQALRDDAFPTNPAFALPNPGCPILATD
jgi:cytochrome c peroxidase